MSRPKRIDLPHCLYHVISRTNSGDTAFHDNAERNVFLKYLVKYTRLMDFRLHAFCLMGNHFHLLLESGQRPGLSELMRRLLTAYTVYFNKTQLRHGHLFQGRFKSFVVDKAAYLLTVSRYIHRNPLDAETPQDSMSPSVSSFSYYARGGEPAWLTTAETLQWFSGDRQRYERFVLEGGSEDTMPMVLEQRYLGNEAFAKRMRMRLGGEDGEGEARIRPGREKRRAIIHDRERALADGIISRVHRIFDLPPGPISKIRRLNRRGSRAMRISIMLLLENLPWTYSQIAEYLGLKNKNSVMYHITIAKNDPETDALLSVVRTEIN